MLVFFLLWVKKPQILCDFFNFFFVCFTSYELSLTSSFPSSTVSNVDDVVAVGVVVISDVESNWWCFTFCRGGFDGCSRHSSFDDEACEVVLDVDAVGRGIFVEAVFSAEIATWNSFSIVCFYNVFLIKSHEPKYKIIEKCCMCAQHKNIK